MKRRWDESYILARMKSRAVGTCWMPRARCWGAWRAGWPDCLPARISPLYVTFLDTGDHVIIVNAEKIRLTGKKLSEKLYRRHTGYPGGLRE